MTFNRKTLLRGCLKSLQNQSRALDSILVVDNASTDGTLSMLSSEFPDVETLVLTQNEGGAGGFHEGMKRAFEMGFSWIWIMDDDGTPNPDCLQLLLEAAADSSADSSLEPRPAVLLPLQIDNLHRFYGVELDGRNIAEDLVRRDQIERGAFQFTFVGPLISRAVIERVGLPFKDFFIWLDDIEYALRIRGHADLPMAVVPRAHFFHDPGGVVKTVSFLGRKSVRAQQPAWKIYYGARNGLAIIAHLHPNKRALWPYFAKEFQLMIGDLIYEPTRFERVRMRLRGIRDGALRRMGKRV